MPVLDQSVIRRAKLELRVKSNTDVDTLTRDLREILTAMDARLAQMEALAEQHENRITALE